MAWMEGLHLQLMQGLGQQAPVQPKEQAAHRGQAPEDGVPAPSHEHMAAEGRRDHRRHAEEDGHLRHHLLGGGGRVHVANDGPRHHHAGASRQPLKGAAHDELGDRLRQGTAHRGQGEQGHASEHHRAPAEAVGQCPMKEVHHRKGQQIGRQGLLHLQRCGPQRLRNALRTGEGRQIGIDGKRPDHPQAGQQQGQLPARAGPELCGLGIHENV